ncbi:hypothetical protein [Burkholderia sp. SIMBA_062]|uniref:hypothetical protein n=1 Tax=Burkholderia sp. SIMBA_062 TaxID=3085803 RepID=UPI00397B41FB
MDGIDGISPAPTPKVGIDFMIGLDVIDVKYCGTHGNKQKACQSQNADARPFHIRWKSSRNPWITRRPSGIGLRGERRA